MQENRTEHRILWGVILLMSSNIIVKLIGILFKIPLHELLGDLGMGYFNVAYNIYASFYTVSTSGLPIALSIYISESRAKGKIKETKKIFRIAFWMFLGIGTVGAGLMYFLSGVLAAAANAPAAANAIKVIAPTLFFICVSSSMRGFFHGHQNMAPTAISEIFEAVGKFAIGIVFAKYAISCGYSLETSTAFAIAGVTIGAVAGMIFLCSAKLMSPISREEGNFDEKVSAARNIVKRLLIIAVPVTISSLAINFVTIIDTFTITNILSGYTDNSMATAAYGNYTTLAVTLFHLPSALIYPIATNITPAISRALADNDAKKVRATANSAIKIAAILSIPSALGMSALSKPVLSMLFSDKNSVNQAAPLLSILAIAAIFTATLSITTSILQSHKRANTPIISIACGSVVKLILNIVLMSFEGIGIYGAPIATCAAYFVMALINILFVEKKLGISINFWNSYLRPLIAAIICTSAAIFSYKLLDRFLPLAAATLAAILLTIVVYFFALLLVGGVREYDVLLLPKGAKIASVLKRIKLLRK